MVDNIIIMNIIKLNHDEIKFIKCFYGLNKSLTNTSNKVRVHLNNCINKNIYFITFKINNTNMGIDPAPGKCKIFNLHFKDKQYNLKENENIYFYIKLAFNIVFKNEINGIGLDKYNYATIFGKGPTFKNIDKKDKELRSAINQAGNFAKGLDLLCMNDHHNIFEINDKIYKNLKYLLIPEYMHINQKSSKEGYFETILEYLNNKFFGNLIIYDLKTSKKNTQYIIDLQTAQSSGNNCFEFIGKYTNIKLIDLYGVGIKSKKKYNDNFIGNGLYTDDIIETIVKVLKDSANIYKLKYKLN